MSFIRDAVAFARNKSAQPENANLNPIPVVVDFEVRTVQQEGEALDAAMDRAITAHKLRGLERVRVDDVEQGSGLMEVCRICDRRPAVGDQISVTTWCKHAFHSHCLVRWLEGTNKCPICPDTAYGSYLILGLTFEMV
ncbi:RING-H2 finger protein atl47 [Phtheirospermum japonicum]|uniref:RING-H2 finger protein atl47 n=1 Tax=Phtheirospermum japonicum TaxID=374723 RepID=A0A830C0A2_9LAMI|nr:RING-H2 finger protein atl47 [Phtheirospermum japonicum]